MARPDTGFVSIDPRDGRELARRPALDAAAAEGLLERASAAQRAWARRSVAERAARIGAWAAALRAASVALAERATAEMGKRPVEGLAEVEKSAAGCEYYAARAPALLADAEVASDARRSLVVQQPLGVVLAVMPWNFPYWQAVRAAAPALAAGNALLLKPAPNVAGCAELLAATAREAGIPDGAFALAHLDAEGVARALADPRIAALTFTGSERTGRLLAAQAGAALKKCVLELGGADPFVVLEDADLDAAAEAAVRGRFQNCGQSCIAAKRFIVVEAVAERFVAAFVARAAALALGDPADAATALGPMARVDLRDALHAQVEDARARGAALLLGGEVPARAGAWYPATVLDRIAPGMRAWREELFGPVASVVRVADEAEALRVANGSAYGLGGSVWTGDAARGERLARALECGMAFVNGVVKSDPRLPFGGVKGSGYGRELGAEGLREFVNAKTLWLG